MGEGIKARTTRTNLTSRQIGSSSFFSRRSILFLRGRASHYMNARNIIDTNCHELSMNYPLIINNSRLIGNGFDAFATVHRFSSDLHFKTMPSIIDGLWIFVLNNKLLFKLLASCSCCLHTPVGGAQLCIVHYALKICSYVFYFAVAETIMLRFISHGLGVITTIVIAGANAGRHRASQPSPVLQATAILPKDVR